MSDYRNDLKDSAADFLRVVWPTIKPWFGGGELIPVEGSTDKFMAELLDQYSGIDAWHISDGKQIRGIASRVQWGKPWNTFTVRYQRDSQTKTEYAKRIEAIQSGNGWLYPHLTVQAYVAEPKGQGALLSVAAIKTHELITTCTWIIDNADKSNGQYGIRRTSNAVFIYAGWNWLTQHCQSGVKQISAISTTHNQRQPYVQTHTDPA